MLIAGLYLPMLSARFDFDDDGNLVYPAAPMTMAERVGLVWTKVAANYSHLGPFRPVLWVHWELQADLLDASEPRWRLARLLWMVLAATALLWLLHELRVAPIAAALTAVLAFWSMAPNEIWRSLTFAEGVAMPYALGALICAVRAGRSRRAWGWDLGGVACVVAALGCKNTFAALVPAQILLRVAPDGQPLAAALRAHRARAALLASTLLLPVVHLAIFLGDRHPGPYKVGGPTWSQLVGMIMSVQAAVGLAYIAPALLAAMVSLQDSSPVSVLANGGSREGAAARAPLRLAGAALDLWRHQRATCRAGVALLAAGIGIYLPMDFLAGRYAIPAMWGALLLIAALLTEIVQRRSRRQAGIVLTLFAAGVAAAGIENLIRQDSFTARIALLWEALEIVEREALPGTTIAWQIGPDLTIGEGIHFYWHVQARGRPDLRIHLLDPAGQVQLRPEVLPTDVAPTLRVTSGSSSAPAAEWVPQHQFTRRYLWGRREYTCTLWSRAPRNPLEGAAPSAPGALHPPVVLNMIGRQHPARSERGAG